MVKTSDISGTLVLIIGTILFSILGSTSVIADSTVAVRVLVFGDSIAAGYGLDPAESFPAQLQEIAKERGVNIVVTNAGLSGETTAGGSRRIDWVLNQPVEILLIELGGNDALRGLALQQTEKNLVNIITSARKRYPNIRILLAGMLAPPNLGLDFSSRFREIYPRIAKEQSVTLIPFILDGVGGEAELNQADGIHPTAAGQRKIAELVWPYLGLMIGDLRESPSGG